MRQKPPKPSRWRTVTGSGGPTKPEYRSGSADSTHVDSSFLGVVDGKMVEAPLGLNPFKIKSGSYLAIVGSKVPADYQPKMFGRRYMGDMLTTEFSFSQLFGYFEMQGRLPLGKGMRSAFWLMPVVGQWPADS